MKKAARQEALDFLTGLGITDANSEDVKFKKRKVTGSLDDLGYEGDFVLKLNKKGRIKSVSLGYEYDNGLYVEIDWKKIKSRKFEKAILRGYMDEYQEAMALSMQGDVQGYIDIMESIPGAGDLSASVYGFGQYVGFD